MFRTAAASRFTSFQSFPALSKHSVQRTYTTSTVAKSTWPLYLSAAGVAGLGLYVYLEWDQSSNKSLQFTKIQEKSPLDPNEFINFKLKRVEPYNHNTSKFVFELPGQQASLLPVASCVLVKASDPDILLDKNGKPVIRPYTPISPSQQLGELTFLIKKYDNGKVSKYIHSLNEGESLSIKGPIMKFDYKLNEFSDVILIGGGSGITPLYQILNHALSQKDNRTKFKLIFANVEERDILLRKEFDLLKKKHPDTFDFVYTLDRPSQDWKGLKGFVNREILEQHLPSSALGSKIKVFVCGPPGQVSALAGKKEGMKQGDMGGILKDLGFSSNQVFKF